MERGRTAITFLDLQHPLCERMTRNRAKLLNTQVEGNNLPSRPVGTPKIKTKYTGLKRLLSLTDTLLKFFVEYELLRLFLKN